MSYLLTSFIFSAFTSYLIIKFRKLHINLTGDKTFSGPQKFHTNTVPRIGGISILLGLSVMLCTLTSSSYEATFGFLLLLCAIPTFSIGLIEDLTKNISINTRIAFITVSGLVAIFTLEIRIIKIDISLIDVVISFSMISILFTLFAIVGLTNSYNIIDGFNGISSMVATITLLCIAYAYFTVNDISMMQLCLGVAFSTIGFFLFNYPKAKLFLGDGGAYFIGFCIAILSILLSFKHPQISPWFALLVNSYPVTETIFSIYRRKARKKNIGAADGLHLHTLIYRRLLYISQSRLIDNSDNRNIKNYCNSATSPILWIMTLMSGLSGLLFMNNTYALLVCLVLFILLYSYMYKSLVFTKSPGWILYYSALLEKIV